MPTGPFTIHNPVCSGCDQSQLTQFRWGPLRWDELYEISDKNNSLHLIVLRTAVVRSQHYAAVWMSAAGIVDIVTEQPVGEDWESGVLGDVGAAVLERQWHWDHRRSWYVGECFFMLLIMVTIGQLIDVIIDLVSIILLVAFVCVCVRFGRSPVWTVWPWFLARGSTLTLASLGLCQGRRSRSNSGNCLRFPV